MQLEITIYTKFNNNLIFGKYFKALTIYRVSQK